MKGGPFALSFSWPDLALVVLIVSVKSGPFSVRSVVWRKKRITVRVRQFFASQKAPTINVKKHRENPLALISALEVKSFSKSVF